MKKYLFVTFLFLSSTVWGSQSMRRCLLLPISDSVGGAIGFSVYEEIEYYLKNSNWCYYRSNSEIIDILANYRNNLKRHLGNKDVLKLLAEKTRAGALMRVDLKSEIDGIEVELKIIGDNGEDVYFSDKTQLEKDDIQLITSTIKSWLERYEQSIPYDGRIIGVLGDQFTVDVGKEYGALTNSSVKVLRAIKKRKHPLFNEVVEWETEEIGTGSIFHVIDLQSQAKIKQYSSQKRLQIHDWVVINKNEEDEKKIKEPYESQDSDSFGKLGKIGIGLVLGSSSDTISSSNQDIKKIGGLALGVDLDLEVWLTRKYWIGFEVAQKFSSFKEKEGSVSFDSNSASLGAYKAKIGYKYLPLGFFYGPQIDFFTGFTNYSYGLDTARSDGFSSVSFSGLTLGTRGSVPLLGKYRAHLELDFIFSPSFSEEVIIYGDDDSSSSFHIGIGGTYDYSSTMSFQIGLDFIHNKANFVSPTRELKLKESTLNAGAVFTF